MSLPNVSPYTSKLTHGNAYWMARLSKEVYSKRSKNNQMPNEGKILNSLQKDDSKFLSVFGVDEKSSQAALIEHNDYLCMTFRGTNEVADWLDNLNVFSTKVLFGEFHRGFWEALEDVWEPIYEKYRELRANDKRPLFITGHSLGGAMATVATAKFVHDDQPFTSTYTFGQPRAMSRDTSLIFNSECKSRYFRFHNNNDIVTRVPARIMNYSHVGSYLYISLKGKIHPEPGFWFRFLDHVDGALEDLGVKGLDGVKDHSIDHYIDAIKKWKLK